MKIKPEDFEKLKAAITPLDTPERRARYIAGAFPRAEKVKDIDQRYRWDLCWASTHPVSPLYDYLNDNHIDTALRAIVPPLEGEKV